MSMTPTRSVTSTHALLEDAAAGRLPPWAEAGEKRRAHMARVAALLDEWAAKLGLDEAERVRWRAAGWLHDALRDAPPERLRPLLSEPFRDLPAGYLHGPATAERLRAEGVDDTELLDAIRYHTLGWDRLGTLGLCLIAADFLEPGRVQRAEWRAALRARMPHELNAVMREVVRAKVERDLQAGEPVRPELLSLWNALVRHAEARS